METLIGRLILFGYTWALIHHMLGGIRHLIWDLGYGFGPVEREWLTARDPGRLDRLHHPDLDRRLSGHGRDPMTERPSLDAARRSAACAVSARRITAPACSGTSA